MHEQDAVQYVIDRDAVAAEVARIQAQRAAGVGRWYARQFLYTATAMYLVAFVAQWGRLEQLDAFPTGKRILFFTFPAIAALMITWWLARQTFGHRATDVEARVREIGRNLQWLGGSGWPRRTIAMGLSLGLAIGIPIGTLMAVSWQPEDLPLSSRWLTVPVFTGMTLLWTIPAAFVLRWLSLLGLRRFVKQAPDIQR
jgi:hypothetical protein